VGDLPGLLELCAEGNFIVVPAAPALADLPNDAAYREAVERSDFAITDSGLMVLWWKLLTGETLTRISGLKLLRALLETRRAGGWFWIMPSEREMEIDFAWLRANGHEAGADDGAVAPVYPGGALSDPALLARIEARRPKVIVINLGGGVQERLGWYLRRNLSYRPTILCTGAAIAFLSGVQAGIPPWADALALGWLLRCLHAPGKFVPRYLRALRFIPLLARYRERSVGGAPSPNDQA
jgi:UDP-N-acetyl-D-mannosaminuronic acid transferase (WecB/TagA/CpsF family)